MSIAKLKDKYIVHLGISESNFREILKHFTEDTEVSKISKEK
jgi:hypothetical protein